MFWLLSHVACHTHITTLDLWLGNSFQENEKKTRESLKIYMDKYDSSKAPSEHQSQGRHIWWLVPVLTPVPLPFIHSYPEKHSGQFGKEGMWVLLRIVKVETKGFSVFVLQFNSYSKMAMDLNYHQKLLLLCF